jgi:methyl-accepting chemotaxis protein
MMKSLLALKLRTKAALIVGAILVLALSVTTLLQLKAFTSEVTGALQVKTQILATELGQEIRKVLEFGLELSDIDDLDQRLKNLTEEQKDLAFAMVVDQDGGISFHNDESLKGTEVDPEILDSSSPPEDMVQTRLKTETGEDYVTVMPLLDNRKNYRGAVILGLKGEVVSGRVSSLVMLSVGTGAVACVVMLSLILVFISTQITHPLQDLVKTADAAAGGDLTTRIESTSGDEIGDLCRSFAEMLGSLRNLQGRVANSFQEMEGAVGDMSGHSGVLQTVSDRQSHAMQEISTFIKHMNRQARNITGSMDNLSRTAEETSSSIMEMMASIEQVAQNSEALSSSVNETSSSVEEVLVSNREVSQNIDSLDQLISQTSSAVSEIDANIKEVQVLAQDSRKVAEEVRVNAEKEGSAAISETVQEMEKIRDAVTTLSSTVSTLNSSVDNIGAILNVIDDVAEQTNLLALNAAIIAAQAGEHGRGFAVVADEIRELAERTSSSTKEISKVITGIQTETKKVDSLVKDGVGRVDTGAKAVGRTDQALQKIIVSSEKAVDMSTRIAQATVEQASGSREVARSIHDVSERSSQISKATREQSRGNENIVRAMENMRDLAEQLRKATVEQSSGAKLIAKASEGSTLLAQEVSKSAQEGSDLSEQAVSEANAIIDSTKETLDVVSKMNSMVERFNGLAENLKKTLSHFRT